MSMERFWGLYDYRDETWLGGYENGRAWNKKPSRRTRYLTFHEAKIEADRSQGDIVPRPFYVVRKAKCAGLLEKLNDLHRRMEKYGVSYGMKDELGFILAAQRKGEL